MSAALPMNMETSTIILSTHAPDAPRTATSQAQRVASKQSIDGDGFSTALLIMGSYRAKNYAEGHPDLEAVFITRDGRIEATSGIREAMGCVAGGAESHALF